MELPSEIPESWERGGKGKAEGAEQPLGTSPPLLGLVAACSFLLD